MIDVLLTAHGIKSESIYNKNIKRSKTVSNFSKSTYWKFLIINEFIDDTQKKHNILLQRSSHNSSNNLSCPLPNPIIIPKSSTNSLDHSILYNFYRYLEAHKKI